MIEHIARQFEPITLEQMSGIKLMNRTDTKFVTSEAKLLKLLELASSQYLIQETDGLRIAPYGTVYFDTEACEMYAAHHNGHLNRQKVRIRSYIASGLHFLEVKTKDNHRRTSKKRITMPTDDRTQWLHIVNDNQGETADFLHKRLRYDNRTLLPRLENSFRRITLVNKARTERLTIDSALKFYNLDNKHNIDLDGIAIIELKRDGLMPSPVLELLRQLRITPSGFSKYCMGMALTDPELKQNRFKERLHNLTRIAAN